MGHIMLRRQYREYKAKQQWDQQEHVPMQVMENKSVDYSSASPHTPPQNWKNLSCSLYKKIKNKSTDCKRSERCYFFFFTNRIKKKKTNWYEKKV